MPVEPELVQQTIAARSSVSATCRAAAAIASAPVASGSVRRTCSEGRYMPSFSTSSAIRFMVVTASTGYWPAADSADSITASAPSKIAVATSETSARVGTGLVIINSSIWVATITGLPAWRQARVISFCTPGTFSSGISTPRSPRATISASARSRMSLIASPPAAFRSWPSPQRGRA